MHAIQDDPLSLQVIPSFLFQIHQGNPEGFNEVEQCVINQLQATNGCSFVQSADFTRLRRMALYERHHEGCLAVTGRLCVRLHVDNRVIVKWN